MSYSIESHTADVILAVTASSYEELMQEAFLGLMEYCSSSTQSGKLIKRHIVVSSPDSTALVVDFLNEVLTSSHILKEQYHQIKISALTDTKIEAEITGYITKTFATDVKAVTYHGAEVVVAEGKWKVDLVLDV